jgi:hypothetical protein
MFPDLEAGRSENRWSKVGPCKVDVSFVPYPGVMSTEGDQTVRENTAALIAALVPLHPCPEQLRGKSREWLELELRAIQHRRHIILIDGYETITSHPCPGLDPPSIQND